VKAAGLVDERRMVGYGSGAAREDERDVYAFVGEPLEELRPLLSAGGALDPVPARVSLDELGADCGEDMRVGVDGNDDRQ
jgi:hypothetical protein